MLTFLQGAALVAATLTMGWMAGVFGIYANAIMPGLGRTDDRTFVSAFPAIDRAIINPLFMTFFLGPLIFTVLAGVLHLGEDERPVLPWIVAGFALYLVVFVITITVNVPLNDRIKAAVDRDGIPDPGPVRREFQEALWARWNLVRALATTAGFGCLAWALVEYGHTVL